MKDPVFESERRLNLKKLSRDRKLKKVAANFMVGSIRGRYSYNFDWLGRPIIQYPQDIIALQEIIWKVKPDLIIETGIARGGSLIFSASMLELIGGNGRVLGVDIDIRSHNRIEIEKHRMFKRIKMIEGSSIDAKVIARVKGLTRGKKKILVYLDSSHTSAHVLQELELYSRFVSRGSYIIVFDTIVEYLPTGMVKDRPWGKGNNPATAVREFLKKHKNFVADRDIENKLLITAAPGGFLRRVR
ncbi:MAG: cephalosporin hydroxylase family protein [Candidatus Liptonbacteria bacterium]|nr:cephalosporin hydroxylase family protein [Candidatus Liptonbacteria bacterium]